ncbi:MAG: hypothetical protein K5Q00_00225, partial [Gammaproteobacteria bacterium]|nr:hypothetical protein [Gammaproteobacteria bacterium]
MAGLRLFYILWIMASYRLDQVIPLRHLRWLLRALAYCNPLTWFRHPPHSRAKRLRLALIKLGPLFVKFGQVLSTRPDLLPADIVNELAKLRIQPGEWQEITNEHSRLAHAASLIEGAQFALNAISESDNPLLSQMNVIHQKLSRLTEFDEGLQSIVDALEPARIHLQETTSALNDYLSRVDLDPERLRIVEERVEALHS